MSLKFVKYLDRQQIAQVQHDSHAQWGGSRGPEERLSALYEIMEDVGSGSLHMEGLVDASGKVFASLKRYTYHLVATGSSERFKAIGIGAVFTLPEQRGQGHASALIHEVMDQARTEGFDAALLFSDIRPEFYTRLGFVSLPAETAWTTAAELPAAPPLQLRPATRADWPMLLDWYERSWPESWTRVRRQVDTWGMMWRINGCPSLNILSDGPVDLGYIATGSEPDEGIWIDEWCVDYTQRAALAPRVLATAGKLASPHGKVGTWLRPGDDKFGFAIKMRSEAVPMLAALRPSYPVSMLRTEQTFFGPLDHI